MDEASLHYVVVSLTWSRVHFLPHWIGSTTDTQSDCCSHKCCEWHVKNLSHNISLSQKKSFVGRLVFKNYSVWIFSWVLNFITDPFQKLLHVKFPCHNKRQWRWTSVWMCRTVLMQKQAAVRPSCHMVSTRLHMTSPWTSLLQQDCGCRRRSLSDETRSVPP